MPVSQPADFSIADEAHVVEQITDVSHCAISGFLTPGTVSEIPLADAVAGLTPETTKMARTRVLLRIVTEEEDPAERERLINLAHVRTGISTRALWSSADAEFGRRNSQSYHAPSADDTGTVKRRVRHEQQEMVAAILNQSEGTVTFRAQNSMANGLVYITSFDTGSIVLSSDGSVLPVKSLPVKYRISDPAPDRSPMTPVAIRRYSNGATTSGLQLLRHIRDILATHVIFADACVPTVLALWIMSTYCYTMFQYIGYVWLTSLRPQSGKSLVAKIVSLLAFNSTAPLIDPTPATVFREIEANSSTFVLDELENLDPQKKAELLGILNAGFERGAYVARMASTDRGWIRKTFHVYCPKVVACLNEIPAVLETRVFRIDMKKKKHTEQIKGFEPDYFEKQAVELRDDMAIFALRNAKTIAGAYQLRAELVPRNIAQDETIVLDDRLRDILAPLYAIAEVIDNEIRTPVATRELDRFTETQVRARASSGECDFAIAIHALYHWAEPRWHDDKVLIKSREAFEIFRGAEVDGVTDMATTKALLRKLKGRNEIAWWNGFTQRGYVFYRRELQDLLDRNPLFSPQPPAGEP